MIAKGFAHLVPIPEISRLSGVRFHGILTVHSSNTNVSCTNG